MMNDAWLTDSLEILQSGRSPSPPSPDGVAEAVESHRAPRRIRSMHGFICPVCFAELPTNHELTTHYEHEHAICGAGGLPGRQCESGDGLNASGAGPSWKPQALGVHRKLMGQFLTLRSAARSAPGSGIVETSAAWKVLVLEKLMYGEQQCRQRLPRREYEEGIARWADGAAHPICPVCHVTKFGLFERQHHCRLCGTVVCSNCSLHLSAATAERMIQTFLQYDRRRTTASCTVGGERVPAHEPLQPTERDVGKNVWVDGLGRGVLRYLGPADFAHGDCHWYGIELTNGRGWTDGSMYGTRYFHCRRKQDCGIFVPARNRGVVLTVTLYDRKAARHPEVGSVRVCSRCAGEIDLLCNRSEARMLFAAERAISHANPPEVLMVYRDLEPAIVYLQSELPVYVSNASRVLRFEDFDLYDETVKQRDRLNEVIKVLSQCALRLRKLKRLGKLATEELMSSSRQKQVVVRGHDVVWTTTDVNSLSVVENMLIAIENWSFAIPRNLLRLPSREDVEAARERLRTEGDVVEVLEYEHMSPSGTWRDGRYTCDMTPFQRIRKLFDQQFPKSSDDGVASLDEVEPHVGKVWSENSSWQSTRGKMFDSRGWQYSADVNASKWTSTPRRLDVIRRRRWIREQETTIGRSQEGSDVHQVSSARPKSAVAAAKWHSSDRWIDDAGIDVCMCCRKATFNLWVWKHHCRHCGRVVCYNCSEARTWHTRMKRLVRTCIDCAGARDGVRTPPSTIPIAEPDDDITTTGIQEIAEVWECDRYEGTTWSAHHLTSTDGLPWKTAGMQSGFLTLDDFETSLPSGAKWISSQWFLESGRWMYADNFPSPDNGVTWTYTYSGRHQVRRRKWIRRVWKP